MAMRNCQLLSMWARVQFQTNPPETRGGQSGTGTGFTPSVLFSPCPFNFTNAPYSSIHLVLMLYDLSD